MKNIESLLMIILGVYFFYEYFKESKSIIKFSGLLLGSVFIFRGISVIIFNLQIVSLPFILLIILLLITIILLNRYATDMLE